MNFFWDVTLSVIGVKVGRLQYEVRTGDCNDYVVLSIAQKHDSTPPNSSPYFGEVSFSLELASLPMQVLLFHLSTSYPAEMDYHAS